MNKTLNIGCKIISLLIFLTLLVNLKVAYTLLTINPANNVAYEKITMIILALLFIVLNVLASWGMYLVKRWGFFFSYIAIPFTTMAFSLCYIPFVDKFLSMPGRIYFMFWVNVFIFAFIIYLNVLYHRYKKTLQKLKV